MDEDVRSFSPCGDTIYFRFSIVDLCAVLSRERIVPFVPLCSFWPVFLINSYFLIMPADLIPAYAESLHQAKQKNQPHCTLCNELEKTGLFPFSDPDECINSEAFKTVLIGWKSTPDNIIDRIAMEHAVRFQNGATTEQKLTVFLKKYKINKDTAEAFNQEVPSYPEEKKSSAASLFSSDNSTEKNDEEVDFVRVYPSKEGNANRLSLTVTSPATRVFIQWKNKLRDVKEYLNIQFV